MPPNNNEANNNDLRNDICAALQSFESQPLHDAAIGLLGTLGYRSDKTIEIPGSDPQAFLQLLAEYNPDVELNKDKALFDDWLKADILFQLTDEELSEQNTLFKNDAVNAGLLQSYLFFAVELKQRDYARGKLTAIARQLNRVFPMPVMVFIKHQDRLSIAVINRRLNKRDADKDVLGKVTIIRDISLAEPHRGHLDILQSFALPTLVAKTAIHSFDALHAAWEEIFNVELLNERFYKELFNWYFWALPEVRFPDDTKPAGLTEAQEADWYEKQRATGLIRLLTRLIFCWFLKEKGLIPEALFDKEKLAGILKSLDDDEPSYHQAILQNLFFATLNQRMNARGEKYRVFAKDEGFLKNRNTYGVDNLYRYESLFRDPEAALKEFEDIPFLNGGLFECLDRTDENGKKIYVDGFSRNKKKRPQIPNRFFFGEGEVDVGAVTGERRRGTQKARGLIDILANYKFTIVENTPIDQEIALDPELLGKVFENLLASYNEETKTTARKQTGSFYTPRPIVDYMVDESLKAHLATVLEREHGMSEEDARTGLDILFAYTEKQHPFNEDEAETLIRAIDRCKILDPACGSGAFPMGVLHKLVYILTKLDPDNARWKQTQLDKLDSISMREELERTFEHNNDDYGRKLYLIENCLYGVDIQPIAIQLSKLRFFISLICDQKTNRNKQQNHGVRPLPNLETKFVAANTLIGLGQDVQMELFKSPKIVKIEQDLQKIRHDYFSVQRRQQKLSLQKKDKELREKLANELVQSSFADQETSLKLANWNPYDPHIAADFFEPLWMFDRTVSQGFDVVIGNPPYFKENDDKRRFDGLRELECYQGKMDVWYLFACIGIDLLRHEGILSYIATNNWITNAGASKLRNKIIKNTKLIEFIDFHDFMVFESASIQTMVMLLRKDEKPAKYQTKIAKVKPGFNRSDLYQLQSGSIDKIDTIDIYTTEINRGELVDVPFRFNTEDIGVILEQIRCSGNFTIRKNEVAQGIVPNPDKVNARNIKQFSPEVTRERGISIGDGVFVLRLDEADVIDGKDREYLKPVYEPVDIERYAKREPRLLILYIKKGEFDPGQHPSIINHLSRYREIMEARRENKNGKIEYYHLHWPRDESFFKSGPKILVPRKCGKPVFHYTEDPAYVMLSMNVIKSSRIDLGCLSAILNSSVVAFWLRYAGSMQGANYQIDTAPLMSIPIAKPKENDRVLSLLVTLLRLANKYTFDEGKVFSKYIEDVVDACVFEQYFYDHMKERNLLFQADIAKIFSEFDPDASESEQLQFLDHFYQTTNAPDHPIRNRLLRLTADSPDLLAVIKEHGAV